MRAHYWQYILNSVGQPVSGADVSLKYIANNVNLYLYIQQNLVRKLYH